MSHYYYYDKKTKSNEKEISSTVNNNKYLFITDNGVFSKNKIDFGTRLLLNEIDIDGPRKNLNPLLDLIMKHVQPTNLDKTKPFAMLSTLLYADSFLGRSLVGKIAQGTAKANQQIKAINLNSEKVDEGRLTKIFRYEGTKKVPIQTGEAGDIVIIAGLE